MAEKEISWEEAVGESINKSLLMNLSNAEIGKGITISFLSVRQNSDGSIVASVDSEGLEGDTLWLSSARYGAQNGLASLLIATDGKTPEGMDLTFTKVESKKSPAGYAFHWAV